MSGALAWLSLCALVLLMLAIASFAPGARTFFALPFAAAVGCFLPSVFFAICFRLTDHKDRPVSQLGWVFILCGISSMQFFVAGLMALSALNGASVFAAFVLFTTAFHGRVHRVSLSRPFLPLGSCAAFLFAAFLARSNEHLALLGVVGPASVGASLFMGKLALEQDRATAETERLRAAVQAQMLEQQERDVGRLSKTVVEILGYNHDINNALMAAGSAVDMLTVVGVQRNTLPRTDFVDLVRELNESLDHIKKMVLEIRSTGKRNAGASPEAVSLVPVLDSVRASMELRFPEVILHVEVARQFPFRVMVRGGVTTLRRIIENLVTNACEGDGIRGAQHVILQAASDASGGRVELLIEDNGPGFSLEQLRLPIMGLSSSKPEGTGLGLYTAECLLRASGGTMERGNRPEGGARLRVLLPLELR